MTDEDKNKKRRGPKPKHRETIRKLHDAGYKPKDIQDETGASKGTVSKEIKKYREDDPVNYYKVFSSEEELKALQKTELIKEPKKNIHIKKPLFGSVEKTRVPARNRVFKPEPYPIKLNLKSHYQTAIRKALDNYYRWTKYNIQEIRDYLEETELKINPVPVKHILAREPYHEVDATSYNTPNARKNLYHVLSTGWKHGLNGETSTLDIEWKTPKASNWIKLLLNLWEKARKLRGISNEYLTVKEWYEKTELEFPQILEPEADRILTNRKDLERTGIFEDIENNITRELGIEDEIERLCYATELTPFDITHAKNLIRENPTNHYSVLLKDKIQYNEIKTDD